MAPLQPVGAAGGGAAPPAQGTGQGRPIPGGLRRERPPCAHGAAAGAGLGRPARAELGEGLRGRRSDRAGEAGSRWPPWRGVGGAPARPGQGKEGGGVAGPPLLKLFEWIGEVIAVTIIEIKGQGGRRPWPAEPEPPDGVLAGGVAAVPPELGERPGTVRATAT